jgi:hypothetical protein
MFLTIPWNIGLIGQGEKWQIVCEQVLKKTRATMVSSRFFFLSADEVIMVDN